MVIYFESLPCLASCDQPSTQVDCVRSAAAWSEFPEYFGLFFFRGEGREVTRQRSGRIEKLKGRWIQRPLVALRYLILRSGKKGAITGANVLAFAFHEAAEN